jgi:hypothetical protein
LPEPSTKFGYHPDTPSCQKDKEELQQERQEDKYLTAQPAIWCAVILKVVGYLGGEKVIKVGRQGYRQE